MRTIFPGMLLVLSVFNAGCPDSLAQRCPSNSLPSGNFGLTLALQHTTDECLLVRSADGGPGPTDGSLLPPAQPVEATVCAGNSSDGGPTVYFVVANSNSIRQSPLEPAGGFTFVTSIAQAQTLCGCIADVNETISGVMLGGGSSGFTLGPDGGLVPQPTGIDASVVQALTNPDGGPCQCNLPCAEHYTLSGAVNR
jgi:hypothetical protein